MCLTRAALAFWRIIQIHTLITTGVELSVSEMDYDGSLRTFESTVSLLPGTYRVKFLVDGQWRLAPEW